MADCINNWAQLLNKYTCCPVKMCILKAWCNSICAYSMYNSIYFHSADKAQCLSVLDSARILDKQKLDSHITKICSEFGL